MQKLVMTPACGERLLRYVGDQVSFSLSLERGAQWPEKWQSRLRTNLGRGETLRREILHAQQGRVALPDASWRDIPMVRSGEQWRLSLSLTEVGFFQAKVYAIDEHGQQHWPDGPNFGVSVHPDSYRTGNTIYCAFTRMFGETKDQTTTRDPKLEHILSALDRDGFTVIPPSGKLRDLVNALPHIIDTLGCRILHLLPVGPTPTTAARFGRFGSPYAVQDLLAIDPALVDFDKKTTGIDQFRELTYAVHARGGRVFLDIVINHTGWGAREQENHPEWYLRDEKGGFVCPGAWGVTWEDLSELNHRNPELWEYLAGVFLEWCRRGVDGFRCDAGYKIPVPAWRYITARVVNEFPDTVFLLEGLGGSWEATENLLTDGGMQWAYSELFQNYSRQEIASYLDYCLRQSSRLGVYVHYSETHDNDRLAGKGRDWSVLRNRLSALCSVSGGFGFTCGVEWLAPEKIQVHESRGLAWGQENNIIPELARLNQVLCEHPAFFDGAQIIRLSVADDPVLALSRVSAEGLDRVLVLVNTDLRSPQDVKIEEAIFAELGWPRIDLLGQPPPQITAPGKGGKVLVQMDPGAAFCLSATPQPVGLSGDAYRQSRAQAAWAITNLSRRIHVRDISPYDWRRLAGIVQKHGPEKFLSAVVNLDCELVKSDLLDALEKALALDPFPQVVRWRRGARNRITLVPGDHWLLIEDTSAFRATLRRPKSPPQMISSLKIEDRHVACFIPEDEPGDMELTLERYAPEMNHLTATVRFLGGPEPIAPPVPCLPDVSAMALLTNGRGGMARVAVDLGSIRSKYDCLLGANLHPSVPVDRHIFVERARVWVNADGFIMPLDWNNLVEFEPGPPARWRFVASAGDDRAVEIILIADMIQEWNTTVVRFHRPATPVPFGRDLPLACRVHLVVRFDLEDRGFHSETQRNAGAEHHFSSYTRVVIGKVGFEFAPALDRRLQVWSDVGAYHPQEEWTEGIPHPVEATRGQAEKGDAFSPGWFEIPLSKGEKATVTLCADPGEPAKDTVAEFEEHRRDQNEEVLRKAEMEDALGRRLSLALHAFVVRRGQGRTVIAGYPWFLDWGRDSFIAARGLIAAGFTTEVRQLLENFARFEKNGTLPNSIHGEDASNRDTSDAPLWFGVACEDLAAVSGNSSFYFGKSGEREGDRPIAEVLRSIGLGYREGTPNGIRMDPESGLIWSPSHFTWMDTNYPAATPREGYPIEIQVLWVRLLRQLARLQLPADGESWESLAQRAEASIQRLFWREQDGWMSDLLIAKSGVPARTAVADNALRSNCLFAISFGLLRGEPARRCIDAALQHLVVPGALRSLAPLPMIPPLPISASDGRLLNDPQNPYWGRYEGDEDTRRKPAYHNGTAWVWTFPTFCEALALAWDLAPGALEAARIYLTSVERLLGEGCVGQLPEIVDGDAPHAQRGCDAQAWSVTEAFRVWKFLNARARRADATKL